MSKVDEVTLVSNEGESAPPEKQTRKKRPLSVSPTKSMENLCNLPGGCCIKCKEDIGCK